MSTDTVLFLAGWPPRDCEGVCLWLNARLDGECAPEQASWLAEHLQTCEGCAGEWAALERTRLSFLCARLREPSDFERDALRRALAPRLLLIAGWTLLGLGAGAVTAAGAVALARSTDTPLAVKAGAAALAAGALLLLARAVLERRRVRRRDPYRDVQR